MVNLLKLLKRNKTEKQNKEVPFNVKDLEKMLGKEFYIMLCGDYKMLNGKIEDYPIGSMIEVTSRQPGVVNGYFIENINKVKFEDGSDIYENIENLLDDYIFTLEKVEFPKGQHPILKGQARKYDLHNNTVDNPLEKRIMLHMEDSPTYKSGGGPQIGCF